MKLSLDTIGYGGYFTARGEQVGLEEAMRRAARMGYDAVCVFAHRPIGFPADFSVDRRRRVRALARELGLEFGAVVCCTNFQEGSHVLLCPQEKELLYVRAAIDFAADLGCGIVRVLAAFWGYFQNPYASLGYGYPAFGSRSLRVSRNEDFLEAWHQTKRGLREVALYARERGVTLALQAHPEVTGNYAQVREMIDEVGVDSLKVALDLPLLESTDPDFVRRTVRSLEGLMVYSHTIAMATRFTIGGAPYAWEEISPGGEGDLLPWETFIAACREIGYAGCLSHDQGCPKICAGHKLSGLDSVDRRFAQAQAFFRHLLDQHNCYSGRKSDPGRDYA